MMPYSRKYDFQPGTKANSGQVDEEFDQLIAAVNQIQADDISKDTDLRSKAQMKKITSDAGGVKLSASLASDNLLTIIQNEGVGPFTFYAVEGSQNMPPRNKTIRGHGHITSINNGYLIAQDYQGVLYTNYLFNGAWIGWSTYVSDKTTQDTLWAGVASYMMAATTITPTKKISDCRNGWMLIWSDYDAGDGAKDYDFAFTPIPKEFVNKHNGLSCALIVPSYANTTSKDFVVKKLYVSTTTLVGQDDNGADGNGGKDVCLRYVIEY